MLTDSKIRAAKPLAKSYKLTDAQGLYLTALSYGISAIASAVKKIV